MTEADTCHKFIIPKLQVAVARAFSRWGQHGVPSVAADGLQQAKEYVEMLGLKFAYASNGPDTLAR